VLKPGEGVGPFGGEQFAWAASDERARSVGCVPRWLPRESAAEFWGPISAGSGAVQGGGALPLLLGLPSFSL